MDLNLIQHIYVIIHAIIKLNIGGGVALQLLETRFQYYLCNGHRVALQQTLRLSSFHSLCPHTHKRDHSQSLTSNLQNKHLGYNYV